MRISDNLPFRIEDPYPCVRLLSECGQHAADAVGGERLVARQSGGHQPRLLHHPAFLALEQLGFVDVQIEDSGHGHEHHQQVEREQAKTDARWTMAAEDVWTPKELHREC